MIGLAELLSPTHKVINYDRRGRGDSDEAGPFAVEREIDDIAALIAAVGGRAALFGFSSGGALALRAAGAGIGVARVAVYEAPFMVDRAEKHPPADYGQRLDDLIAAGDSSGAVRLFMRNAMGMPAPVVAMMRLMPVWKDMAANAHTLSYDWAALGEHKPGPARGRHERDVAKKRRWSSILSPAFVLSLGGRARDTRRQWPTFRPPGIFCAPRTSPTRGTPTRSTSKIWRPSRGCLARTSAGSSGARSGSRRTPTC